MVDNKEDNTKRDGHAVYSEDIRDGHLLPDETKLRKSVKYGGAALLGFLVLGMWGSNIGKRSEIKSLRESASSLEVLQTDLDASNTKISGYESEIGTLKESVASLQASGDSAEADKEAALAEWKAKVLSLIHI